MSDLSENNRVEDPMAVYGDDYTYEDYLKFDFDYYVELIKGKIFKMSPSPNTRHQMSLMELSGKFYNHFKGKPCQVFFAPYDVILPVTNKKGKPNTVVEPDLCVICDLSIIQDKGCFGVPDFLIEIISPHTTRKDIKIKFDLYQEVKVKEYWVIYPDEKSIEMYILNQEKFELKEVFIKTGTISPHIFPEFSFEVAEIFDY